MEKGNKDDKSLEAETWYDLAGEKRREEKRRLCTTTQKTLRTSIF
jgi:hypothetical protein